MLTDDKIKSCICASLNIPFSHISDEASSRQSEEASAEELLHV
jgi:hypothetical protein